MDYKIYIYLWKVEHSHFSGWNTLSDLSLQTGYIIFNSMWSLQLFTIDVHFVCDLNMCQVVYHGCSPHKQLFYFISDGWPRPLLYCWTSSPFLSLYMRVEVLPCSLFSFKLQNALKLGPKGFTSLHSDIFQYTLHPELLINSSNHSQFASIPIGPHFYFYSNIRIGNGLCLHLYCC